MAQRVGIENGGGGGGKLMDNRTSVTPLLLCYVSFSVLFCIVFRICF